jgi:hypothetical protein
MRELTPLRNPRAHRVPVALLLADGSVMDEDGRVRPFWKSKAKTIYSRNPLHGRRICVSRGGIGYQFDGQYRQFTCDGRTIHDASKTLDGMTDTAALAALIGFRDFALEHGVSARSLTAMAFYLLRSTLEREFWIARNEGEIGFLSFAWGARRHAVPGWHPAADQYDMRSAYLWALATLDCPSHYRRVNSVTSSDLIGEQGFARVRFRLRRSFTFGPLATIRRHDHFRTTIFQDKPLPSDRVVMSLYEVALAHSMDIPMSIRTAWIGEQYSRPFAAWGDLFWNARLDPVHGRIAKSVANMLWGVFKAAGSKYRITFRPDNPWDRRELVQIVSAQSPAVAGSVVARLRTRIFQEAVGSKTLHVHTDGIMVEPGYGPDHLLGENMGSWRKVGSYRNVVILDPNTYSYETDERRIVKAAGTLTEEAARRRIRQRIDAMIQSGEIGEIAEPVAGLFGDRSAPLPSPTAGTMGGA